VPAETAVKTNDSGGSDDHSAELVGASAREGKREPGRVLARLRSRSGHEYYVTDSPEEYRRLQAEGATVYSPKELEALKEARRLGATDRELQVMIDAKRILGGHFDKTEELRG